MPGASQSLLFGRENGSIQANEQTWWYQIAVSAKRQIRQCHVIGSYFRSRGSEKALPRMWHLNWRLKISCGNRSILFSWKCPRFFCKAVKNLSENGGELRRGFTIFWGQVLHWMSRLEGHLGVIQINAFLYVVYVPLVVHEMILGGDRWTWLILMCL